MNSNLSYFDDHKKLAVILTYNHTPDLNSVLIVLNNVDKVLIIDNNSLSSYLEPLINFCTIHPKCSLIRFKENLGISAAYNRAVEIAAAEEYYFLFFFDHDAIISENLFVSYRKAWDDFHKSNDEIGIIVPTVTDDPHLFNRHLFFLPQYSFIESPINSGIMTTVSIFLSVGGYNSDFFMELADYEFSRRIREFGLKIIRINDLLILQTFEEKIQTTNYIISFFDFIIRFRSIVRLGICNSNIYRTRLSIYNSIRKKELRKSSAKISKLSSKHRMIIAMVTFLNYIEENFVYILSRIFR